MGEYRLQSLLLPAVIGLVLVPSTDAVAQRRSQAGSVGQTINETTVSITYNRPVARGRTLFGGIIPFGETWNPGADEATEIAVSTSVTVGGRELPAGRYSIWMTPRRDRFTVIFSGAVGVNHVPYPGEARDVMRLDLVPTRGPHMETLAFYFPVVEGREGILRFHWGSTMVDIPIEVP